MTPEQENQLEQEFENLWLEMTDYAETIGYSVDYVEDEFFLEGSFIKVPLKRANFPGSMGTR